MMGIISKLFGTSRNPIAGSIVEDDMNDDFECDLITESFSDGPVKIPGYTPQDAVGFFNLGVYKVSGHIKNPSTGRPNKKILKINAVSVSDAETFALDQGLLEPLSAEVQKYNDIPPNEYQISDARECGVKIPNGAVDADVGAMVYRKQQDNGMAPTSGLAVFCTQNRLLFSRYIGEHDLSRLAYNSLPLRDRIAFFAYAVHCYKLGKRIGNPLSDPTCYDFSDNASPTVISYIEDCGFSDLPIPRKGTKAWNAVCDYYSTH
jgi:hypothetical protein